MDDTTYLPVKLIGCGNLMRPMSFLMVVALYSAVNFINVKRANFTYESDFWQLFLLACNCQKDVRTKNMPVKCWWNWHLDEQRIRQQWIPVGLPAIQDFKKLTLNTIIEYDFFVCYCSYKWTIRMVNSSQKIYFIFIIYF